MKPSKSLDPKWGFWDITDEQAERINNGDVDEFNAFFVRNLDVIHRMARNKLYELSTFYQSDKDIDDIVNAFYYDLRKSKLTNAVAISYVFRLSALCVDRSSKLIANSLSQDILVHSFKNTPTIVSNEIIVKDEKSESIFFVSDEYEQAPSPIEEIETENEYKRFLLLCEKLAPIVGEHHVPYLPFYLSGVSNYSACQRLNVKKNTAYRYIEKKLIQNFESVLRVLDELSYNVPLYLRNELPPKYIVKRRQRAQVKTASTSETA